MAKKAAPKKKVAQKRKRKRKPIRIKVTAYVMSAVLIVLLAVAALIAKPYIKERGQVCKGASVPTGYYCYGIDISKYQPDRRRTLSESQCMGIKPWRYFR